MAPRPITASFGMNAWDTRLTRETLHRADIVKRLSTAVQAHIEHAEFMAMPKKSRQELKKQDPYVAFGSFKDNKRDGASLESRSALTLSTLTKTRRTRSPPLSRACACPSPTSGTRPRSHKPDAPRLRIIVPLGRDASDAEYRVLVAVVAALFPAAGLDNGSLEPARIMYLPVQNKGADFKRCAHAGDGYLNPDCYLEAVDPEVLKQATRPALAVVDDDFSALEMKHADPRWTLGRVKDELLSHLDPNADMWDRSNWLKLGMILHHQGEGDDEWLELWDAWSSQDERVNDDGVAMYQPGLCEKEWESFGRVRNVATIGTVITWVKDARAAAEKGGHHADESEPAAKRFELRSAADLANAPPMQWLVRDVAKRRPGRAVWPARLR